ncbi:PI-PLC X domain-containing protein 3-like [Tigriopus californicus]|uniref:PI-PLC X domain-containing protein 3-like n=1 Tax=Tigriopus californicus TaxID=6832 RepID=UPI0027DA7B97|nr:PI-PLC X domain-containing protein 3-like [Tigriopus californicus]
MDLANWMRDLSPSMKAKSVLELSIPGSHNSFTHNLSTSSVVGPDQPQWIQKWAGRTSLFSKPILRRWGVCQKWNCREQLEHGIRFFDLRLGKYPKKSLICGGSSAQVSQKQPEAQIRILHGLFGDGIGPILCEIRDFLDTHPGELVLIDIHHTYDFTPIDFQILAEVTDDILENKLIPQSTDLTFQDLLAQGQVILSCDHLIQLGSKVWSRSWIQNPWPNTEDLKTMDSLLIVYLENRYSRHLHVSQGILTASMKTVRSNFFSSMEEKIGRPCTRHLIQEWIPQTSRSQNLNVVLADFVDESGFVESVISLNDSNTRRRRRLV